MKETTNNDVTAAAARNSASETAGTGLMSDASGKTANGGTLPYPGVSGGCRRNSPGPTQRRVTLRQGS
ncbi:hypothetical protein [Nitrosovibrio sp. Nv4]|uniref:hypothetical protein n=1 Tax=Nitrosovibrio sp. Nv4 TaxID=1945880 RepID=UPI000BE45E80|nr:hypothetical protein [Nitrosovibrio sp. Nv4]